MQPGNLRNVMIDGKNYYKIQTGSMHEQLDGNSKEVTIERMLAIETSVIFNLLKVIKLL